MRSSKKEQVLIEKEDTMNKKQILTYIIIAVILALVLGVLWFLIVNNSNKSSNTSSNSNSNTNNSPTASYTSVKEISEDEDIRFHLVQYRSCPSRSGYC